MSPESPSNQPPSGAERRSHPRIPASALPHLTASIPDGPAIRLLDLSRTGALVETTTRLPPGASIAVHFRSGDREVPLSAAVIRSTVSVVDTDGRVTYHTGLAFTDELVLLDEAAQVAGTQATRDAMDSSGDFTLIVMDGRESASGGSGVSG